MPGGARQQGSLIILVTGNQRNEVGEGQVRKGYAICGEPRSGSTLLARVLSSTGEMGRPYEFFRTARLASDAEGDPVERLHEYVERASTPNGVYGFKIFSSQFDLAERTGWAKRLPNLSFIHLRRVDLLGQAISQIRARQSGKFESGHTSHGRERYYRAEIERELAHIAYRQCRWDIWFARNGLSPLRLTYEDVAADPENAMSQVAALIDLGTEPRADMRKIKMVRMADEVTSQWRSRFLAESTDLTWLDEPISRLRVRARRWRASIGLLLRHSG